MAPLIGSRCAHEPVRRPQLRARDFGTHDPVFQDLGTGKTMFHIDPNLYLVLNRHSLMLVYLKIS